MSGTISSRPASQSPMSRDRFKPASGTTIRIEIQGTDIRCFLNGNILHDTSRILDNSDRTRRFQTLQYSPGFNFINGGEQQWLNNLAGRNVYLGNAALSTFSAMPSAATYNALTAAKQGRRHPAGQPKPPDVESGLGLWQRRGARRDHH